MSKFSLIPEATVIELMSGSGLSFALELTNDDGTALDMTGYEAIATTIFRRGSVGAVPAVLEFTTDLDENTITISLTPAQSAVLVGTWGYVVYLGNTDETLTICALHGSLTVSAP